ncbi:histidine phosphatase family protein [Shewanella aestuarii]|uniref:Histidine phosphatase family protein n=1 Tax=Shewanella aestuarii TaxID=1028752 RepID=A0A6G9QK54_9GAMM|nr:histidine phosphatase family protein [Shewanella aestuarii]QIR14445.1 histidine phosphatase family protein [Shewanella aestuarii]
MANVILVRHGQASFATDNYDRLSSIGELQAKQLGKHLAKCQYLPAKAISGNMHRHITTQEHSLAPLSLTQCQFVIDPAWNEFDHENVLRVFDKRFNTPESTKAFLSSQLHPQKAFITAMTKAMEQWQQQPENNQYSESWQQFNARINEGLARLATGLNSHDNVIVFTSGGVISALVLSILGLPASAMMSINRQLTNASMTKLYVKQHQNYLVSLNEHAYLLANSCNKAPNDQLVTLI